MSRYPLFERRRWELRLLAERGHDMTVERLSPLALSQSSFEHPEFDDLIEAIVAVRQAKRPVVVMMGGHPIKLGLSRFIVDLIERQLVTYIATNGAGIIHDFELALVGGTSENVAKWIEVGQFGLWHATSRLNDIIVEAAKRDESLGEAVGRVPEEERFPNRHLSITAAGYRCRVPVTSHVSIGNDIIHAMPDNFRDGPPDKDHPLYYYRPWKTILCRTIADGGKSYYFQSDHIQTIPTLWHELVARTDPDYAIDQDRNATCGSRDDSHVKASHETRG